MFGTSSAHLSSKRTASFLETNPFYQRNPTDVEDTIKRLASLELTDPPTAERNALPRKKVMVCYDKMLTGVEEDSDKEMEQATSAMNTIQFYINRARSYRLTSRYEEAWNDLALAYKLDPNHPGIFVAKGGIHKDRKEYREAEEALMKAADLSPDSQEIRKMLVELRALMRRDL